MAILVYWLASWLFRVRWGWVWSYCLSKLAAFLRVTLLCMFAITMGNVSWVKKQFHKKGLHFKKAWKREDETIRGLYLSIIVPLLHVIPSDSS